MENLERDLKRAMRPVEPPAGFADRAVARAIRAASPIRASPIRASVSERSPASAGGWLRWLWMPVWRPALAGALAVLLIFAAAGAYQRRQERKRAEKAAAELMLALEITSAKLNRVAVVLNEPHRHPQEVRQ